MRALAIARLGLLFSLLLYGASLLLGAGKVIEPGLGFLIGLISAIAIVVSAAACLVIQVAALLRGRSR